MIVNDRFITAAKCALADLVGIMPEYEPSGNRGHPAWKTIVELYDQLQLHGVDVRDYTQRVEFIREGLKIRANRQGRCPHEV